MKRYVMVISILIFSLYLYGCKGEYFGPGTADFNYVMSGDYKLFHAGETDIWRDSDNGMTKVVEGNITGIGWNNDFILVEQKKDNSTNYWIIDVKEKKTYGAFNENDFESKRKELNVNSELKLEKPEKYKSLEKQISNNKK